MSDIGQGFVEEQIPDKQEASNVRRQKLVELLEEDRLGFRLERFVAVEREKLATLLTDNHFSINPHLNLHYSDLFTRVQAYDIVILPFAELFAVGCAYSMKDNAPIWTDFLERVATCNQSADGGYNPVLANLTLDPAWLLLYGAGLLAVARNQWTILKELFTFPFAFMHDGQNVIVLRANSFNILPEQGQKAIPGRERESTPLLNHLYEVLRPVFSTYFHSEAKFAAAFARFEVMIAAAYGCAQQDYEKARFGEVSDRFWVPIGRFWWSASRDGSLIDTIIYEAQKAGDQWPPIAAGMYGGKTEIFTSAVEQVKVLISKRGFW